MNEEIIIFKNDKIGDLLHAYNAIQDIINKNLNKKVLIFLSHYNSEMKFLFKSNNVRFKIITEKINKKDKIKLFLFFLKTNIKEVYIFKPSNFLFFLPLIFYLKKIKFFGICVDNINYKRPALFLRNFLTKISVNDRGSKKIRKSINELYMSLINNNSHSKFEIIEEKHISKLKSKDYILVHYNKFKFNKLNLGLSDLNILIDKLIKLGKNIVLTNDLNDNFTNNLLLEKYNNQNKEFVSYYPNIKAEDLFKLIGNAKIVISFHGTITSMAAIQKTKVIDLFNCEINSKNDFYRYKNAFHEFVPKLKNYEFMIPKKNFNITINRIENLLLNGRKINY
tara:strand:- start:2081 stop:3091 length:1011 start_codon:yes stop_codon:yes gene_type:complete